MISALIFIRLAFSSSANVTDVAGAHAPQGVEHAVEHVDLVGVEPDDGHAPTRAGGRRQAQVLGNNEFVVCASTAQPGLDRRQERILSAISP